MKDDVCELVVSGCKNRVLSMMVDGVFRHFVLVQMLGLLVEVG